MELLDHLYTTPIYVPKCPCAWLLLTPLTWVKFFVNRYTWFHNWGHGWEMVVLTPSKCQQCLSYQAHFRPLSRLVIHTLVGNCSHGTQIFWITVSIKSWVQQLSPSLFPFHTQSCLQFHRYTHMILTAQGLLWDEQLQNPDQYLIDNMASSGSRGRIATSETWSKLEKIRCLESN